jgi:hypothetical protein
MRVKDQRTLCAGRVDLAENDWRYVWQFQQARFDAAPLEHLLQSTRRCGEYSADRWRRWARPTVVKFGNDLVLVLLAVLGARRQRLASFARAPTARAITAKESNRVISFQGHLRPTKQFQISDFKTMSLILCRCPLCALGDSLRAAMMQVY